MQAGFALQQLRAELALIEGGMPARDRVLLDESPALLRAIEAFPDAEKLLAQRKKTRDEQKSARAKVTPSSL